MARLKKYGFLLALFFLLIFSPGLHLRAAVDTSVGNVTWLSAKAVSETSVKLSWSKATNATKYNVYLVNQTTGKIIRRVASTQKRTVTLKDLQTEQTLCYKVYAYRKVNGKYYRCTKGSPKATVSLAIYTPAKVSGLRTTGTGNCTVILKWNAVSNASGYEIALYNSSKGTYTKITQTTNLYHKITGMKSGKKYTFAVRAYRSVQNNVRYGSYSDGLAYTAKSVDFSAIHGRRYSATVASTTTATVVSTGKTITVKKGTTLYPTSKSSGTVKAELTSGVMIKISGSKLTYGNLYVQTTAYTTSQKEAYVNAKGYISSTPYLIWINQYTLTVTVFKGSVGEWEEVRSMICCIGKNGKTPVGVYKICKTDTAYGGPRIYFTWNSTKQWGNSFHRRIDSNTQAAVSNGCIRLADSDLYYIATNCAMGTTVVSY